MYVGAGILQYYKRWKASWIPHCKWRWTSSWLHYHIKELTVWMIILGQSRFRTFPITGHITVHQHLVHIVCSSSTTVESSISFGWSSLLLWVASVRAMTRLNFHNKQKTLYKNNIQYWNDSIHPTNWLRLSSLSKCVSEHKQANESKMHN